MAYVFADYPELGFAMPFLNLSFERWDGTLPEEWATAGSPTGTRAKYNPGFDLTRALKISETGVVAASTNRLIQSIDLPDYMDNGQQIRSGYVEKSDLAGHGAAQAAMRVAQNTLAYQLIMFYAEDDSAWSIFTRGSDITGNHINTSHSDISLDCFVTSYNSEANPGALFDCFFVEYGRSTSEQYYTLTRKPEFSGLDIFPQTFVRSDRTGVAKRRTWDSTGGAVKWNVKFPFVNIPGALVDALYDFWIRNQGLDDHEAVHLVLHHKMIDTSKAYDIRTPPWIICDIANTKFPFKRSGGYLGAELWSGTLIFEEV